MGVGVGGLAKPLGLPMTGCVQQQEHVMHGVCRAWVGSLYCFGCSVCVWPLVEEWYDRPAAVGCAMCAALVVLVAWWLGRRLRPSSTSCCWCVYVFMSPSGPVAANIWLPGCIYMSALLSGMTGGAPCNISCTHLMAGTLRPCKIVLVTESLLKHAQVHRWYVCGSSTYQPSLDSTLMLSTAARTLYCSFSCV